MNTLTKIKKQLRKIRYESFGKFDKRIDKIELFIADLESARQAAEKSRSQKSDYTLELEKIIADKLPEIWEQIRPRTFEEVSEGLKILAMTNNPIWENAE